jgi:dihydrofolate reductase
MQWADALLLGRVTYDGMSQAWPAMGNDPATGGDIMNSIGKYVPTSTLTEPTWNATFLDGDVVGVVSNLKSGPENLLVYGSGQLTETLRAAELIDEYRLLICPIVLGEGRKLFTSAAASGFTVADSRTTPSGMVLLTLATAQP